MSVKLSSFMLKKNEHSGIISNFMGKFGTHVTPSTIVAASGICDGVGNYSVCTKLCIRTARWTCWFTVHCSISYQLINFLTWMLKAIESLVNKGLFGGVNIFLHHISFVYSSVLHYGLMRVG